MICVLYVAGFSQLSSQQRLLADMFSKYDEDGTPHTNSSRAVCVSFGAKLVRIINLVGNTSYFRLSTFTSQCTRNDYASDEINS